MKSFQKKKVGQSLGFRTADFFKQSRFSKRGPVLGKFTRPSAVIHPRQFHTQHKGGS